MEEDFSALIQKAIAEAKEANEKRNPTLLPAEEKSETESKPSFDIELAMKRSLMIDPTKTKRNQ